MFIALFFIQMIRAPLRHVGLWCRRYTAIPLVIQASGVDRVGLVATVLSHLYRPVQHREYRVSHVLPLAPRIVALHVLLDPPLPPLSFTSANEPAC